VERLLCFFVFLAIEKSASVTCGVFHGSYSSLVLPLVRNAIDAFNVENAKPEEAALDW
jgi:hypothetical protein